MILPCLDYFFVK